MLTPRALVQALSAGQSVPGASRRVEGPDPPLVLIPSRAEVWLGECCVAQLKRSQRGFRLLLVAATQGEELDRAALYEAVWEERYRGSSSDNRLRVALSRLRKEMDLDLVTTATGGLRLAEARSVWVSVPPEAFTRRPDLDLLGRDSMLEALTASRAPLATLTGTGGVGKSAMARALLGRQPERWSRLVGLESCTDVDQLWCALAEAVGVQSAEGLPERVSEQLAGRGALLVLDGAEGCVEALRQAIDPLLEVGAQLVVTSRVPLRHADEQVVVVPPLDQADAVRLFEARMAQHGRPPSYQERGSVEALVDRLDRLPLAIELAAARSRLLPPDRMLHRLDRLLDLLADGNTSLRAVLAESWKRLSPEAGRVLARLSLMPGGFSLEAAEAISELDPDAPFVLDLVQEAHDHGLLVERGGRFHLLETVRAFAEEQVVDRGAAELAIATWLSQTCDTAIEALDGSGAGAALKLLVAERDNLLAVHARGGPGRLSSGLALVPLILLHGNLPRPLKLITQTLEQAQESKDILRLRVARAQHLRVSGKAEAALLELEDLEGPDVLRARGMAFTDLKRFSEAEAALADAPMDSDRNEARLRESRGVLYQRQQRLDEAGRELERASALFAQMGNVRGEGRIAANLADIYLQMGQPEAALTTAQEGVAASRASGDGVVLAYALANAGLALQQLGRDAIPALREALQLSRSLGDKALHQGVKALLEDPTSR